MRPGVLLASARANRPVSIRDVKVFLRLSDAIRERVPGEALRAMVAKYDWRHTFSFFATVAASWANGEEAAVQGLVTKPLWEATSRSTDARDRAVAKLLASTPDPVIVHEELFYFLEALALLAGAEGGAQ